MMCFLLMELALRAHSRLRCASRLRRSLMVVVPCNCNLPGTCFHRFVPCHASLCISFDRSLPGYMGFYRWRRWRGHTFRLHNLRQVPLVRVKEITNSQTCFHAYCRSCAQLDYLMSIAGSSRQIVFTALRLHVYFLAEAYQVV